MTTTARAHDKWLDVEPFVSQSPGRTKVYLLTGEQMQHEEMLPERRTSRLSRFEVRSTSGRRDLRARLRESLFWN
jgi:hypothetical protein